MWYGDAPVSGGEEISLDPCPFCNDTDIRYYVKTIILNFKRAWHIAMYCNKCHCYGLRVLIRPDTSLTRHTIEHSTEFRVLAEKLIIKFCISQ